MQTFGLGHGHSDTLQHQNDLATDPTANDEHLTPASHCSLQEALARAKAHASTSDSSLPSLRPARTSELIEL